MSETEKQVHGGTFFVRGVTPRAETYSRIRFASGTTLVAKESWNGCRGCAFEGFGVVEDLECNTSPACTSAWRNDGLDVIWVRAPGSEVSEGEGSEAGAGSDAGAGAGSDAGSEGRPLGLGLRGGPWVFVGGEGLGSELVSGHAHVLGNAAWVSGSIYDTSKRTNNLKPAGSEAGSEAGAGSGSGSGSANAPAPCPQMDGYAFNFDTFEVIRIRNGVFCWADRLDKLDCEDLQEIASWNDPNGDFNNLGLRDLVQVVMRDWVGRL